MAGSIPNRAETVEAMPQIPITSPANGTQYLGRKCDTVSEPLALVLVHNFSTWQTTTAYIIPSICTAIDFRLTPSTSSDAATAAATGQVAVLGHPHPSAHSPPPAPHPPPRPHPHPLRSAVAFNAKYWHLRPLHRYQQRVTVKRSPGSRQIIPVAQGVCSRVHRRKCYETIQKIQITEIYKGKAHTINLIVYFLERISQTLFNFFN